MKVNPQTFFNFCSRHVSLLRALAEGPGEFSEAELMRLIKIHSDGQEELPQTVWRNLRDLQILVPVEPGSDVYLLAEPVAGLLAYLQNEANPATPELIRGYVQSLESLGQRLSAALAAEDITVVKLAFDEITVTLRRIYADLDQTHHAILTEIANYKTERYRVSVRDKFRRIVYWMDRYIEPMIDLVRADGPMRAAFDETERLLQQARAQALFTDLPALERNLRHLRLVGTHALRVDVFIQQETVWLTQKALVELFGVKVPAVNKHLKNIFDSGKLIENSVVSILETTAANSPDLPAVIKAEGRV